MSHSAASVCTRGDGMSCRVGLTVISMVLQGGIESHQHGLAGLD
jgi:hypothetical protein